MTTPNTAAYPAELLPAYWDKNKGIVAKMAGETGIGAALKKLKDQHAGIDWSLLMANGYGKLHNAAEVDEAEKKARAYHQSKVAPYANAARGVRDLAQDVAKQFAANKLIPKSSTAVVTTIGKTADVVAVACKSMDEEFKTFGAARDKLKVQIEGQQKLIRPNMAKLKTGLAECIKDPTKDRWNKSVKQQCRSINNGVQLNPEWKAKFGATWVKYDGETFFNKLKDEAKLQDKPKKQQAEDVVEMCKEIQSALSDLERFFR
jgi:hypothetical protein